jgi:flotillin
MTEMIVIVAAILIGVLGVIPLIVSSFLRNVEAGTIRMVSWLQGSTIIYRGPGKSKEVPLLTTGTTLSSKAINVDLDITDQTADLDRNGTPQPIKVRILASAIVSVGDTDTLIKTAANRFFSKDAADQENILIDLLSSSARRAINLLTHDQLFSAKTAPSVYGTALQRPELTAGSSQSTSLVSASNESMAVTHSQEPLGMEDDDDPLAVIIRKACSRELTDLGLTFNSLNIKVVQSEVAESRRRQSAAEAQANADIVTAQQARRAKDAQLEAERVISDKQRELEQTKAANAALIAEAEAKKQTALGVQRVAELEATQIAQARADAEKMRIEAEARNEQHHQCHSNGVGGTARVEQRDAPERREREGRSTPRERTSASTTRDTSNADYARQDRLQIMLQPARNRRLTAQLSMAATVVLRLVLPSAAAGQPGGSISGTVTAETGIALSGVDVGIVGTAVRSTTDERGAFLLTGMGPGAFEVRARRLGFRPESVRITVDDGKASSVDLKLPVLAEDLKPVLVRGQKMKYTGRLAGYYERL